MKGYLISVLGICVICFAAKCVFPRDGKYMELICGVCIIAVTLAPLMNAVSWLSELDISKLEGEYTGSREDYEKMFYDNIEKGYLDIASNTVKQDICDSFGLHADSVDVYVFAHDKDARISVVLKGSAVLADSNKISEYLQIKYKCSVNMMVGG